MIYIVYIRINLYNDVLLYTYIYVYIYMYMCTNTIGTIHIHPRSSLIALHFQKKIFFGCNFNCFLGLWRELLKNAFRSTVERHFSRTRETVELEMMNPFGCIPCLKMEKIHWGLREGQHTVIFRHTKDLLELWKSCFEGFLSKVDLGLREKSSWHDVPSGSSSVNWKGEEE